MIDDPNAPYLTALAHTYAMADHYYGVTHPSMPNYIASIAGDNFGIQDDNDQNVVNLDRRNLVDQLEAHHISWDAYMEDLPADKLAGSARAVDGTTDPLYAKKHNPFVLFDDVKNNPARMATSSDYTSLGADLNSTHAPQFVWITPTSATTCTAASTTPCPGTRRPRARYGSTKDDANDAALKQKADAFVKRRGQHHHGLARRGRKRSAIVIVTDENDYTGNAETGGWENADGLLRLAVRVEAGDPRVSADWPGGTYGGGLIPAIIVTARSGRGTVDHTPYNHYSLLTTIEENWRLRPPRPRR